MTKSNWNSEREMRKQVVEICRHMYEKDFVAAGDGNVSVKLEDDRFLTTPSGLHKGYLQPDQLVVVDSKGNKISGALSPSSELPMHLCAYRKRPDIGAVVHAHPPVCTAFSIAGISLAQCILPEVVLTLGSIPTTRYATPTTCEGADVIEEYIQNYDALILERHGSLTVGKDLQAAYMRLERIEHSAHVTYMARTLGNVHPLSREQVGRLLQAREKMGLKANFSGCGHCGACLGEATTQELVSENQEDALVNTIAQAIINQNK